MYLLTYNAISAASWAAVLALDIAARLPGGYYQTGVYSGYPHKFLVHVQVVNAAVEIAHSVVGLVPSPLGSLLLQFFARLAITVGVSHHVPHSPGNSSRAYSVLVAAWSVTEMIRYGFHACRLSGSVPRRLLWLRYSAFVVLYPMGLLSEPVVVYKTLPHVSGGYYWFLVCGMAMYLPGFAYLYSYMWGQRRKKGQ